MLASTTLDLHHRVVEAAEAMRPLPGSVTALAEVVGRDDASTADVAAVLREDPGLVAAVLREANSAASAAKDPIATVEAATIRLGLARVLAVAVTTSVHDELNSALPSYGVAAGVLYRHSIAASYVAEVIRSQSSVEIGPELVTAALLHDMGTLVLTDVLDRRTLDAARSTHTDIAEAERELADIDHAELSALLAQLWKLPAAVVDGIRHHHSPSGHDSAIASALLLADAVSHDVLAAQTGWAEELDPVEVEQAYTDLGIDAQALRSSAIDRLRRAELLDDDDPGALR